MASSERSRASEMLVISSTAARNEASFAFDGLLNPVIFLTNWIEADRISSAVTGGSKLKRGLMFLHIGRLGVRRSAFAESTLTVSAGHFHDQYDESDPECLGLSFDPGGTETDTKKAPQLNISVKFLKLLS